MLSLTGRSKLLSVKADAFLMRSFAKKHCSQCALFTDSDDFNF